MISSTIILGSSLLMFSGTAPATTQESPPTCDFSDMNNIRICPGDRVVSFAKACPRTSNSYYCPLPWEMPQAELNCEAFGHVVQCEAWPQSDWIGYQYYFTAISGVAPGYSSSGEFLIGNCVGRGGEVSVTVVHPYGQTSTATAMFACWDNQ
ncbi:hypothetical protein C7S18_18305 [Ahniella affigens]|uniref:Uncharacterized protein n=2 Tax=Ahniella affigens TaxID=2021234 RepID=A0A2P1PVX6_9GAMM|nr:hypothetical protein C7S18_18305 [Ahniella affigens]